MFNLFKAQLAKLNLMTNRIWTRVRQSNFGHQLLDKNSYYHFANSVVFPFLDWVDAIRFGNIYRRYKAWFAVALFGTSGWWIYNQYLALLENIEKVKNMNPKMIKKSSKQLESVLHRFVFYNPQIQVLLADILVSNVFSSQKVEYTLARSLGRMFENPGIDSNLRTLVKETGLKDNVLYSPDIYKDMKRLTIQQLRGPEFRNLMKDQILNYFRGDSGKKMAIDNFSDVLRLDGIRSKFVKGVIEDKVYQTLADKKMAKQLDKQLTDYLSS